jgi:hypothetical protein
MSSLSHSITCRSIMAAGSMGTRSSRRSWVRTKPQGCWLLAGGMVPHRQAIEVARTDRHRFEGQERLEDRRDRSDRRAKGRRHALHGRRSCRVDGAQPLSQGVLGERLLRCVYTAMWNVYLNDELKFVATSPFLDINDQAFDNWDFSHTVLRPLNPSEGLLTGSSRATALTPRMNQAQRPKTG